MKTAFVTLLGTSAVMGIDVLPDGGSLNVVYTNGDTGAIAGQEASVATQATRIEPGGDVAGGDVATIACVKDNSDVDRTLFGGDTRPTEVERASGTGFRGKHRLECTVSGATLVGAAHSTKFYVDTEGACPDREFGLTTTQAEVANDGTVQFTPTAVTDTCNAGRKASEADLTDATISMTLKGEIKSQYAGFKQANADGKTMSALADANSPSEQTFYVGMRLPTADYMEVSGCPGEGDLCLGAMSYEYKDSSGATFHTASGVGFKFPETDYKWSVANIARADANPAPSLASGLHNANNFYTLSASGSSDLLLSDSVDCKVEGKTVPVTHFTATNIETPANIVAACNAAASAQLTVTCADPAANSAVTPANANAQVAYDSSVNHEHSQDFTTSTDYVPPEWATPSTLNDLDPFNRVPVSSAELLAGFKDVQISKPSHDNLKASSVVSGGDLVGETDSAWTVRVAHGLSVGDAATSTANIVISTSRYAGCVADGFTVNDDPLGKNTLIVLFQGEATYNAPTITSETQRRHNKWAVTDPVGSPALSFPSGVRGRWCDNGHDTLIGCAAEGVARSGQTHMTIIGASGCEGLEEGAIAQAIQFNVGGTAINGKSLLPCPAQAHVTLDAVTLDYDIDFVVNADLGVDLDISGLASDSGHSMASHSKNAIAFLDNEDSCGANGAVGTPAQNCDLDAANDYASYTLLQDDLATCGNHLIEQVTFTDVRDGSTQVKFCQSKQLSVGIALQTGSVSATFTSAQVGGVEAVFNVRALEFEACANGGYRQKMVLGYTQFGGSGISPSISLTEGGTFGFPDTGNAGELAFQTGTCLDVCGADGIPGAETTTFTLSWSDDSIADSSTQYSITTHILDAPCAESQEIGSDNALVSNMALKIAGASEQGDCSSALSVIAVADDGDYGQLSVGQHACFGFSGSAPSGATLTVTGVSLTDEYGEAYSVAGDLAVDATGYDLEGNLLLDARMANRAFALTVDWQEEYSRRRLRTVYKLGAKSPHADSSFTVLPAHISVLDASTDSNDTADAPAEEEKTEHSASDILIYAGFGMGGIVFLVWAGEKTGIIGGMRKSEGQAYAPVGRFASVTKY